MRYVCWPLDTKARTATSPDKETACECGRGVAQGTGMECWESGMDKWVHTAGSRLIIPLRGQPGQESRLTTKQATSHPKPRATPSVRTPSHLTTLNLQVPSSHPQSPHLPHHSHRRHLPQSSSTNASQHVDQGIPRRHPHVCQREDNFYAYERTPTMTYTTPSSPLTLTAGIFLFHPTIPNYPNACVL